MISVLLKIVKLKQLLKNIRQKGVLLCYNKRMKEAFKIENLIKKFTNEFVVCEVEYKKLGRPLKFIYLKKFKHEIQVYDEAYGLQEIARISYAINWKGVYISDFIVNYEYQKLGIGRTLFNMATMHGFYNEKELVYGVVSPIDLIAGVSLEDNDLSYKREYETLIKIYEKLGCNVEENDGEYAFKLNIKKQQKTTKTIEMFIKDVVELDNSEKNKD